MHLIKFSSEDCGTCHRMSHYDGKVAEELGCSFISVMLQDTEMYRKYRKILLKQYPTKEGLARLAFRLRAFKASRQGLLRRPCLL